MLRNHLEGAKLASPDFVELMKNIIEDNPDAQIIIFTERIAEINIGQYKISKKWLARMVEAYTIAGIDVCRAGWFQYRDKLFSGHELEEFIRKHQEEANSLLGDDAPVPFSNLRTYEAVAAKQSLLRVHFPKPIDQVREVMKMVGIPNGQVVQYTSYVSGSRASANLERFIRGDARVLCTTQQYCTGVSLHDTQGDKPRVSVVVSLPQKASILDRILGRTHRYGQKSPAKACFLYSPDFWSESDLCSRIERRLLTVDNSACSPPVRLVTP